MPALFVRRALDHQQMLAGQPNLVVLIEDFTEFNDYAIPRPLDVIALLFDPVFHANGVADEYRPDETQAIISVREGQWIYEPSGHAHRHAEDQCAVSGAASEFLGLAPLRIHMVRVEIARLTGVQNDVRFGDGTAQCFTNGVHGIIFEKLFLHHGARRLACRPSIQVLAQRSWPDGSAAGDAFAASVNCWNCCISRWLFLVSRRRR